MKQTIIISAGGTGGHIFPALAIAKQLQNNYKIGVAPLGIVITLPLGVMT
jgi:UDP-N-acetylglucosamine:LPS N-acetylglucosamine transferase